METISNVVNTVSATATKAIWGEPQTNETAGNEPVSGVQGKGTAAEPFDGGNSEDPAVSTTQNETAGKEPVSGLEGKGTATEPFDLGNSADATNTATLPIREKSTTTETADTLTLAVRPDETNTAGLAGTTNLADTLAKTHLTDSKTDGNSIDKDVVPAGKNEPALAGFAENRTIDPEDKSQQPAEVSNATTGDTLTSTKSTADTSAGVAGTHNLSDTLAKTNPPTVSSVTSPKGTPAVGSEGPDMLGTTKGTGEHSATGTAGIVPTGVTESSRIMETKSEQKDKKEASPSGEKEKVSKMEKLKEKLHIGHKH
ncbi:uncharacterized protein CC84DRAFT_1160510 [Paraphaeosphaeria sporulosa]|uniref:Glycine-rich cell wall structural protein 1 n=1 Tax=Paraphaeosphaeria sporulosa TaxID=1460663 RepID=A0A177CPV2_9PLEO|nr:uncharacterized protein CC84DRAFT_1160510 [Paraphaeosphaeria sporulosa]OAG09336.1 hypothetical protein CC84DRAFT_1160510 [Paraphaeosphaeria sporulosa]